MKTIITGRIITT